MLVLLPSVVLTVLFMLALVCDCVLVAVARRIKFGLALVIDHTFVLGGWTSL